MTKEKAEQLAEELVEDWTFGTDLKDTVADWVLKDLREKLAMKFWKLTPADV